MRTILFFVVALTPFFFACKTAQPTIEANQKTTPQAQMYDTLPFTLTLANEYKIDYKKLVTKTGQVGAQFITPVRIFGERGVENKSAKVSSGGVVNLETTVLDTFSVKPGSPGVCVQTWQIIVEKDTIHGIDIDFGNGIILPYGPASDDAGPYVLYADSENNVEIAVKTYRVTSVAPHGLNFITKKVITGGTGKEAPGKKIGQ